MRNFIAMLKDSYKEAVDGWIFQIMLVLAGLLVLLVAGISVEATSADRAFGKILSSQGLQLVPANRGDSERIGQFMFRAEVSDVSTLQDLGSPWNSQFQFTVDFAVAGFGGMEVDADNKPVKPIDMTNFSDPFTSAVRYWGTKPGEPKVKRTDELAVAFVTQQLKEAGSINVTAVKKLGGNKFQVTADGVTDRVAWPYTPSLFFGAWTMKFLEGPLGGFVYLIENGIVNTIGAWLVMLMGVVVTAGFVPNMLRKGAIDLMLTKPMSRISILLFKYFGGLMFVFLLTSIAVGGVWVALGVRTGVWSPGILYCILGITFYFAILYAVSTLIGVLTRNAIVCILVTVAFWFTVWLIGFLYQTFTTINNIDISSEVKNARAMQAEKSKNKTAKPDAEAPKTDDAPDPVEDFRIPPAVVNTFGVLNRITPRTKDLDALTQRLVGQDLLSAAEIRQSGKRLNQVQWGEVMAVSGAYLVMLLGLASLRFVTRSY